MTIHRSHALSCRSNGVLDAATSIRQPPSWKQRPNQPRHTRKEAQSQGAAGMFVRYVKPMSGILIATSVQSLCSLYLALHVRAIQATSFYNMFLLTFVPQYFIFGSFYKRIDHLLLVNPKFLLGNCAIYVVLRQ